MNDLFYCYSVKMYHFLQAMGLKYLREGVNKRTNTKYYIYKKSQRLDDLISEWNLMKK